MVKILIVVVSVEVKQEILIFVVLIVVLEVLEVRFFNFYGYPLMNQNHHLSNFMIMMNLMKNWMKILFFYSFFYDVSSISFFALFCFRHNKGDIYCNFQRYMFHLYTDGSNNIFSFYRLSFFDKNGQARSIHHYIQEWCISVTIHSFLHYR